MGGKQQKVNYSKMKKADLIKALRNKDEELLLVKEPSKKGRMKTREEENKLEDCRKELVVAKLIVESKDRVIEQLKEIIANQKLQINAKTSQMKNPGKEEPIEEVIQHNKKDIMQVSFDYDLEGTKYKRKLDIQETNLDAKRIRDEKVPTFIKREPLEEDMLNKDPEPDIKEQIVNSVEDIKGI